MENKLNQRAIEEYAHVYSDKLITSFFKNNKRIDGGQILNFSSIRQVNLFVLKSLYEQWQREAVKLRSPFFDYEHEKVKEAMKIFLNSLSKHISIAQKDFEPLLHKAVVDSLTLTLSPISYFTREVERNADPLISVSKLKDIDKYIQFNKILIQTVILDLEGLRMQEAFAGEVVRLFHNAYHDNKFKITEWFSIIDMFNSVAPVEASELFIDEQPGMKKVAAAVKANDEAAKVKAENSFIRRSNQDFFSRATESDTKFYDPEKESLMPQEREMKQPIEEKPEASAVPPTPKPAQEPVTNEKQSSEARTLNEKLMQEAKPTIIDKHQRSRIESIRGAIPLNQKFMLINSLFNGDNISWSMALQELENSISQDEAMTLLHDKYARQYNWNMEDETVQELISLVERKFLV